jgi:hypothetical protein
MGLLIIAVGAILAFAVTANTSVLNLNTTGYVLIIVGLFGLVLPKRSYNWLTTRMVRRTSRRPGGGTRVQESTYPTYVVHEPKSERESERVRAGLTAAPEDNEVVEEDVYEEE